jgi:hypothetical protein
LGKINEEGVRVHNWQNACEGEKGRVGGRGPDPPPHLPIAVIGRISGLCRNAASAYFLRLPRDGECHKLGRRRRGRNWMKRGKHEKVGDNKEIRTLLLVRPGRLVNQI